MFRLLNLSKQGQKYLSTKSIRLNEAATPFYAKPSRSQNELSSLSSRFNIYIICAENGIRAGFFPSTTVPYRHSSFHQLPGVGTIGHSADNLRLIITTLIELLLIDVLSQPIRGPQKQQHNIHTQITRDNKQDTRETNTNRTKEYLIN
jgi:hypothetical protein